MINVLAWVAMAWSGALGLVILGCLAGLVWELMKLIAGLLWLLFTPRRSP